VTLTPAVARALAALGSLGAFAILALVQSAGASDDAALRADLEELSRRAIFFGHQSVGRNLLDGVADLARTAGVPVRIVEAADAGAVGPGTFGHAAVGQNGDPASKLESFARALPPGRDPDLALVKLCYVDVTASTDVPALFARWEAAIETLEAAHPHTTFVYVTVPLTTIQGGPKALAKRLLGRAPWGELENARREELNALVRDAARRRSRPLFDLAHVESTRPDGSAETFALGGKRVPALVPGYSEDGAHLVGDGRLRAARELVSVLASASRAGATAVR
jgi:hypothetical protein